MVEPTITRRPNRVKLASAWLTVGGAPTKWHTLGNRDERRVGHDDELGPGAVVVDAHHLQMKALLGVATDDARRADAVSASGVDRHPIADGPDLRYVRPQPHDRPRTLVAGGDNIQRRLHAAPDDMHIGEADPAEGDLDEHLAGPGSGTGTSTTASMPVAVVYLAARIVDFGVR